MCIGVAGKLHCDRTRVLVLAFPKLSDDDAQSVTTESALLRDLFQIIRRSIPEICWTDDKGGQ